MDEIKNKPSPPTPEVGETGPHLPATPSVAGGRLTALSHLFPAGTVLGGHRIEGVTGTGGMGAVYLAIDDRLDRQVAIKTMRRELASDSVAKERFLRETEAAAKVVHDNEWRFLQWAKTERRRTS